MSEMERRGFSPCGLSMTPNIIDDPIHDPRWADLIGRHPSASVFHSPGWLDALRRTYGYEPFVVTASRGRAIDNGLVMCRVRGFGANRLVSLPFSDHCEPLVSEPADVRTLVEAAIGLSRERGWGPIEMRPRSAGLMDGDGTSGLLHPGDRYCLHEVDLRPDLQQIFAGFHHSSTQRAIRRAEREGVTFDTGRSDVFLDAFYRLLRMSRRRHGLPPQPMAWYRNLRDTMGDSLAVHVAHHGDRPVAAVLTLSSKSTTCYKYGGSDATRHQLGAMPSLLWRVMQTSRGAGATTLDLGRSDLDQPGLIAFKDHLGARQSILTYYRYPLETAGFRSNGWLARAAGRVFAKMPDTALDFAGRVLYRHLG